MTHKRILHVLLTSMMLAGAVTPVMAQGLLDRMKEDAQRRAENKAIRDAENPPPAKPADATATPAPAQGASAAPAAPATVTPAPATPAQ